MVFHAANKKGLAAELIEDAAKIRMKFLADRLGMQKGLAIFRRKNRVQENLRQRLSHMGGGCAVGDGDSTPSELGALFLKTQGSRAARQPWLSYLTALR